MKKLLFSFLCIFSSLLLYSQCSITVLEQHNPTCPGSCDGSITIAVTGTGVIDIMWWDTYETTETVSGLCGYTYTVGITDEVSCSATEYITLTEPDYPEINSTVTNETCSGDCSGTISLDIIGPNPPYNVEWNYGMYSGTSISSLCGGENGGEKEMSYEAVITDNLGCEFQHYEYIMEGISVETYFNQIVESDCSGSGYIDLNVYEGNPQAKAMFFNWSNSETTEDIYNLNVGWYYVTVTNSEGCFKVDSAFVPASPSITPQLSILSHQHVNCHAANKNNGYIKVLATGTPPYYFSWSNGISGQSVDSIGNLTPGYYRVTVTDSDGGSTSCENIIGFEIINNTLAIEMQGNFTDCPYYSNGSVYPSILSGEYPFTYLWNYGGQTTENLYNLPIGMYSVTVTDNVGCTAVGNFGVAPYYGIQESINITTEICNGQNNGAVRFTVNSSYPPYDYMWSNGMQFLGVNDNFSEISGIPPGIYSVTVTDSSPYSYTCNEGFAWVELKEPSAIEVIVNSNDLTCYNDNSGSISLVASGGYGFFTYIWDHDPGLFGPDAAALSAGSYNYTVTDANGCTFEDFVILTEPAMLGIVSETFTDITCTTLNDGTVSVFASGGTGVLSYDIGAGPVLSGDFIDLAPGSYTVTITDDNFCNTTSLTYTITDPPSWSVSVYTSTDITCFGNDDGTVTVNATGGTGSLSYDLGTGAFPSGDFTMLAPGSYAVTVTDGNGCTMELLPLTVSEPDQIVITSSTHTDVLCFGLNTGTISVSASGGMLPLSYDILASPQPSGDFINLNAGTYNVIISDANLCSITEVITITEPSELLIDNYYEVHTCYGLNAGSLFANATGGTGTIQYSLDSATWQSSGFFGSLSPGTYTIHVIDANNCYVSPGPMAVVEYDEVLVNVDVTPADCGNSQSGIAEAIVTQGGGGYSYNWTGGLTSSVLTDLFAGIYTVTVIDVNGCTQIASGEIIQLDGWEISGVVQSSAGLLGQDESVIKLFKSQVDIFQIEEEANILNGAGGVFNFTGQDAGFYRINVRPVNPLYLNTWYSETISWEGATVLNLQCGDTINDLVVEIIELPAQTGNGSFSGFVYYWDSSKKWYFAVGEPVEGAEIFVEQQPNDTPVAYATSNTDGFWQTNGLAENFAYNIHVDVPGLPLLSTYSNIPVTSASSDYENLNFYVDTTNAIGGIFIDSLSSIGNSFSNNLLIEVYPNPFKENVSIRLSSNSDEVVNWELFDNTGKKISAGRNICVTKTEQILIPVIEKGAYYLIISNKNNRYIKKLIKE